MHIAVDKIGVDRVPGGWVAQMLPRPANQDGDLPRKVQVGICLNKLPTIDVLVRQTGKRNRSAELLHA